MSLMTASNDSPDLRMISANSLCSVVRLESSRTPVIPMTPFIGVRISWLMLARNSDLYRDAWRASSRACVRAFACSASTRVCSSAVAFACARLSFFAASSIRARRRSVMSRKEPSRPIGLLSVPVTICALSDPYTISPVFFRNPTSRSSTAPQVIIRLRIFARSMGSVQINSLFFPIRSSRR